jgi:Domain of unknown function (DU1801)
VVSSKETTPQGYLNSLPADRRAVISAVRDVIRNRLPKGYVETMNWGMLSYEVPLSIYPTTYNKQPLSYVALAAQKHNYAIYMMNVYGNSALRERLLAAYAASGTKPDMGKCCIRFRTLAELPLDVIGDIVASTPVERMIAAHEAAPRKRP